MESVLALSTQRTRFKDLHRCWDQILRHQRDSGRKYVSISVVTIPLKFTIGMTGSWLSM
jgi:hypothetical protein